MIWSGFWSGILLCALIWGWALLPIDQHIRQQRVAGVLGVFAAFCLTTVFSDRSLEHSLQYLLQIVGAAGLSYVLVQLLYSTATFKVWRQQFYRS